MNNLYNQKTENRKQSLIISTKTLYASQKDKRAKTITIQSQTSSNKKFLSSDMKLTVSTKKSDPVILKQKIL